MSDMHIPCVILATYFRAVFFPGLFCDTEDGVDMFLRNVGLFLTDYTAFIFKYMLVFI
jgi:hypothetical protein